MNRKVLAVALLLFAGLLAPRAARAQGDAEAPWGPGIRLAIDAGAASADSTVAGVAGASLGWEISPRFALEGSGTWFNGIAGADQFAAILGARISFAPGTFVPSLFGGVGMLRASVQTNDPKLSRFYAERLDVVPGQTTQIFEDLVFAAGAGTDIYLSSHLAVRPDVRVLFGMSDVETRVLPVFAVHLAYHFEAHPYLPKQ